MGLNEVPSRVGNRVFGPGGQLTASYGLYFYTYAPIYWKSATVNPSSTGTVSFDIYYDITSGTSLGDVDDTKTITYTSTGEQEVDLGWYFPPGFHAFRKDASFSMYRDTAIEATYQTTTEMSIVGGTNGTGTNTYYYYLFDIDYVKANSIGKDGIIHSNNFSEIGPKGPTGTSSTSDLIYYWPMNGHLKNYGNYDLELTNSGASVGYGGPRGKDYYTFASTDYMDTAWGNGVNPYPMTFSVWCTGTTSGDCVFGAYTGTNQRLYVGITSSTWSFGIANTAWTADDYAPAAGWNHLALTMTDPGGSTGTATLYVNGNANTRTVSYSAYSLGADMRIGDATGLGYYWQGNIMDFRIYNRVLTTQEINILAETYNTTDPVPEQRLRKDVWCTYEQFKEQL